MGPASITLMELALISITFSVITKIMAVKPFKIIQGHQFWYQSKAHILLVNNANLHHITQHFQVTADFDFDIFFQSNF